MIGKDETNTTSSVDNFCPACIGLLFVSPLYASSLRIYVDPQFPFCEPTSQTMSAAPIACTFKGVCTNKTCLEDHRGLTLDQRKANGVAKTKGEPQPFPWPAAGAAVAAVVPPQPLPSPAAAAVVPPQPLPSPAAAAADMSDLEEGYDMDALVMAANVMDFDTFEDMLDAWRNADHLLHAQLHCNYEQALHEAEAYPEEEWESDYDEYPDFEYDAESMAPLYPPLSSLRATAPAFVPGPK